MFKFGWRSSYLPKNLRRELLYWYKDTHNCIKWYKGQLPSHFGHPPPKVESRITGYGLKENAIRTWAKVDTGRYLHRLLITANYFEGMRVLDVDHDFFNAIISVNAIDHTDDFSKTASEICRILRPGGILRFEVHYHEPTVCEPWALNDGLVLKHFGRLGIRKIRERAFTELYPSSLQKGEKSSGQIGDN